MSGPLDYEVRYPEIYLNLQDQRWRAEQERQSRIQKQHSERARQKAEARRQKERKRKVEAAKIEECLAAVKERLHEFVTLTDGLFSVELFIKEAAGIEDTAKNTRSPKAVQDLAGSLERRMAEYLDAISAYESVEAEANGLAESMPTNDALTSFSATDRDHWLQRHAAATSAETISTSDPVASAQALQELIAEGHDLVRRAIRTEAEFQARNVLIQATIESLQSLGFFVDEPALDDPGNLLASVTLTATRGAERVYLSVPLNGDVKSDWKGLPEDACADHLAAYLSQLQQRGFDCRPRQSGIATPPALIAKGAKPLPHGTLAQRSK